MESDGNMYEWNEILGVLKVSNEAKNIIVRVYNKVNFAFKDEFIGEGEI